MKLATIIERIMEGIIGDRVTPATPAPRSRTSPSSSRGEQDGARQLSKEPTPTAGLYAQLEAMRAVCEEQAQTIEYLKGELVGVIRTLPSECVVWEKESGGLIDPVKSLVVSVSKTLEQLAGRVASAEETVERIRSLATSDCSTMGRQRDELLVETCDLKRKLEAERAYVKATEDIKDEYEASLKRIAQELGLRTIELDTMLWKIRLQRGSNK